MLVYHGSYIEVTIPDLKYSRNNLDFGKGFYVTTIREQADKWALRRGFMEKKEPIVSVYEFDIHELIILSFNGYTSEWLDFVVKSRAGMAVRHEYDAVYGNIADDDVAAVVNEYIRLLAKGRISANGKAFFLEQLQYSKPNNQYCFVTQKGIDAMKFIKSYTAEAYHV